MKTPKKYLAGKRVNEHHAIVARFIAIKHETAGDAPTDGDDDAVRELYQLYRRTFDEMSASAFRSNLQQAINNEKTRILRKKLKPQTSTVATSPTESGKETTS